MPNPNVRKFTKNIDKRISKNAGDWIATSPAELGSNDGSTVAISGQAGWVWARVGKSGDIRVVNNVAPNTWGLKVKIGRSKTQPNFWQVISWRESFLTSATNNQVKYHHEQHELGGSDQVNVDRRQITKLSLAIFDANNFIVRVYGDVVKQGMVIDTQTLDLSSYVVTTGAKFVGIEADDSGILSVHDGTPFASIGGATAADFPNPDAGKYTVGWVRFYDGQTQLQNVDIVVPWSFGFGDMRRSIYDADGDDLIDEAALADDLDISGLPVEATPASGMKLVIDNAGTRKQIDWDDLPAGGGGVESVTGDGVDNSDPANPVLSYPTPGDIGAEDTGNKVTSFQTTPDDTHYPSEKLTKDTFNSLSVKAEVRWASHAALAACTYNNGTSGVGATLTGDANGSFLTGQDEGGYAPVAGQRIIIKNQANPAHNGVYVITQIGDGSHVFILTRATDSDSAVEIDNKLYWVREGDYNALTLWNLQIGGSQIIGTNGIVFSAITGGQGIHAFQAVAVSDADEVPYARGTHSYGSKITWANIKATLKTYFDTLYVAVNGAITGATKTKITYDAKGLVTAGEDAGASDILIAKIGTPTVDQIQEYLDTTGSSGFFYGGALTDAGSGNINIAAGRGYIRATADNNAQLLSFEWSAASNVAIPSNTVRYVYIKYNSGSPTYELSADEFAEDETKIMIGVAINDAGTIDSVFNVGVRIAEGIGNAGRWMRRVFGIVRDARRGGLIFSTTGTRNVKCTAGHLWWGRTDYTIAAFDTNVSGSFPAYYQDSPSGWKESAAQTQWDNSKYDDGTGTLHALGANKWANLWFYIEPDGHIVCMYGRTTNNTQAAAELESPPATLPNRLAVASVLAARLTFQSGASAGSWSSAFDTKFTPGQEQLVADSVDNTILANMAAKTYKGRTTNSTGDPEDVPVATLKTDLSLGNVDNTSDANKPVSTAQQTAIDGKVADSIADGVTTIAPSQNAVFDALALKAATSQKLDDFGTPDDNTDLNANTTNHGLVVKAVAPAANVLNVVGIANGETVYANKAILDGTNPAALGVAAPGTSLIAAHRDHVHPTTGLVLDSLSTALNDFLAGSGSNTWIKKTLAETLTILGKAAANGLASLDASSIVVQAVNRLLAGTGALTATEGYLRWDSTRKVITLYDAQRERGITPIGWLPYAYPIGLEPTATFGSTLTLAANGGAVATPVILTAPMLLESVSVWQKSTSTARTWNWYLYEQYLNNGNAGENTLTLKSNGTSADTFTPGAASLRTITAASAPIFLEAGIYWLVIQGQHATSTFQCGYNASTMGANASQTKTLSVPPGATLDFVAATWTKVDYPPACRLNGRVFGQTAAF